MDANANVDHQSLPTFAIACPRCEYLLHGLGGPLVTCPECGATCDIEELAKQYRRRWSTTPLYERMMRPVTVVLLLIVLLPVVWIVAVDNVAPLAAPGIALLWGFTGILSFVWLLLALLAVRDLPLGRGVKLLAMLHAVMAGYLLCGIGVFAGLIGLIMLPVAIINDATDAHAVAWCAIVIVIGGGSALAIRPLWKLDQHIGRACIRHSLHEPADGESRAGETGGK